MGGRTGTGGLQGTGGATESIVDIIDPDPVANESPSRSTGATAVNFYAVTQSRTLRKIEMFMAPSSSLSLLWYVHESSTLDGTYTKISTSSTLSTTDAGDQSSGAMAVPLVAGRYYAISVRWTASNTCWYHTPETVPLSFGSVVGGKLISSASEPTITYDNFAYFPQRLTTGP